MTPLQIQMMLHYYMSADPYSARDIDHASSETTRSQRLELLKAGMLRNKNFPDIGHEVTEKGKVYIEHLLSVPIPSIK